MFKLTSQIEKELIKKLKDHGRLLLFFGGVKEIGSDYVEKLLNVFSGLVIDDVNYTYNKLNKKYVYKRKSSATSRSK